MLEFSRGEVVTLYVNFLTLENKEAASVIDPKITIRHLDSDNNIVIDINEAPLSFAVETLYYFKWTVPTNADLGEYTVEYEAILDGEYAETNETIQIVEQAALVCSENYTDKDKVAAYLGITSDKIQDDWIIWASRYIDLYTCKVFCNVIATEKYDIEKPDQDILMLDHYPIINIIELKDNDKIVPSSDYLVYKQEGFIKFRDDFIGSSLNLLQPGPFTQGRQKVEVTYSYGFNNIPKEIEWVSTVLTASIAFQSLVSSGVISAGDVVEEQIGEYRRRKSESSSTSNFSNTVEGSKVVRDKLVNDVFSAKNILEIYRSKEMRSI